MRGRHTGGDVGDGADGEGGGDGGEREGVREEVSPRVQVLFPLQKLHPPDAVQSARRCGSIAAIPPLPPLPTVSPVSSRRQWPWWRLGWCMGYGDQPGEGGDLCPRKGAYIFSVAKYVHRELKSYTLRPDTVTHTELQFTQVREAIFVLGDRAGSSVPALRKIMHECMHCLPLDKFHLLDAALEAGVASGVFVEEGGRYKLSFSHPQKMRLIADAIL